MLNCLIAVVLWFCCCCCCGGSGGGGGDGGGGGGIGVTQKANFHSVAFITSNKVLLCLYLCSAVQLSPAD